MTMTKKTCEWIAITEVLEGGVTTHRLMLKLQDGALAEPSIDVLRSVAMLRSGTVSLLPIANALARNGTMDRLMRPLKKWNTCPYAQHPDDCTCMGQPIDNEASNGVQVPEGVIAGEVRVVNGGMVRPPPRSERRAAARKLRKARR